MNDHVHPHHHPHDHGPTIDRRAVLRAGGLGLGAILLAACKAGGTFPSGPGSATASSDATTITALTTLPGFDAFAATVHTIVEGDYWLVESNGMPTHDMMVGIVSWQQQVPLPQPYTGANAWRFPTTPVMADTPISARTGLFRGAIAIAVDGVPIFNALNNRGDDAFLAGELDDWGGHSGRADDYHYHVAPLYLEEIVGPGRPIAYALDGYAIYGSTEPDGSAVAAALDEYNGHVGSDGTYHYHGTTAYPYINGGLVGVATATDQVEPQPTTRAFREAGAPLKGAVITGFTSPTTDSYRLEYTIDGQLGAVEYTVQGSSVEFTFTAPDGTITQETYTR